MTRHIALLVLWAGIIACLFEGCKGPSKTEISRQFEQERVTSPNGQLDAVLIRESGGGAWAGWDWYVFIVAKGRPVYADYWHTIFHATTLTGGKLVWSQEHLLEIHYDIADIEQFRNLWGLHEIQKVGRTGENDYMVEIQLKPASAGFSLLTPDGGFRRTY